MVMRKGERGSVASHRIASHRIASSPITPQRTSTSCLHLGLHVRALVNLCVWTCACELACLHVKVILCFCATRDHTAGARPPGATGLSSSSRRIPSSLRSSVLAASYPTSAWYTPMGSSPPPLTRLCGWRQCSRVRWMGSRGHATSGAICPLRPARPPASSHHTTRARTTLSSTLRLGWGPITFSQQVWRLDPVLIPPHPPHPPPTLT